MTITTDPRYPIGPRPEVLPYSDELVQQTIEAIIAAPSLVRNSLQGATEEELQAQYRPGSWTALQVAHHLADSHQHAYLRFRYALAEDNPTIRPYDENSWAQSPDATFATLPASLDILDGVHTRWVALLQSMDEATWHRTFFHPERGITYTLFHSAQIYAWHGAHHAAHIRVARGLAV